MPLEYNLSHSISTVAILAAMLVSASAQDDGSYTRLTVDDALKTTSLAVATCDGETDWVECVSHELICDRTGSLKLYIAEDSQAVGQLGRASAAIIGTPYGQAKATVTATDGARPADFPIIGVQAVGNDLAGLWDFQLVLGEGEHFLEVLSTATSPGLTIAVGEMRLDFAPVEADVAKVGQFASTCQTYVGAPEVAAAEPQEPEEPQLVEPAEDVAAIPTPDARPAIEPDVEPAPRPARGAAAVEGFYRALGQGDGNGAVRFIIPEKRNRGPFAAGAMSRFYGGLSEKLSLRGVERIADREYLVSYTFRTGGRRCNGRAVVRTVSAGGGELIRSIRALNGC